MELDKYQQAWKSDAAQMQVKIDADLLAKAVRESHRGFQSTINWRDCREVGVALLLLPYWFYMGLTKSLPWTWWLTVPGLFWVAGYILLDRKRHPQRPSEPGKPMLFYAKEALTQVEHQIWLLRNVLWWYLLPLCIPMMAFFIHVSWITSSSWWDFSVAVAFWCLFAFVIDGGIYWLNQYAVRMGLEPRRQDLAKLIASLESDSNDKESDNVVDLVAAFVDPARHCGTGWDSWAANWNQIIPTWRAAAVIIIPTLVGALCGLYSGLWIRNPEMGPVFFQTVVGAVIPFEVAFFTYLYWSSRKKKMNLQATSSGDEPSSGGLNAPATGNLLERSRDPGTMRLPRAPALLILVMIIFLTVMAILALISFAYFHDTDNPFDTSHDLRAPGFGNVSTLGDLEMASKLAEICRKHNVPAMTAAVVNSTGLVVADCFGVRKRGSTDKVELSDRFPLSSCTKSMTATLAAVLVENGKIDWDTTMGDVWPNATDRDLHPKLRTVTLDQLLSHRSGLPENLEGKDWISFFDEKQSPQLERKRMLKLVLSNAPTKPQGSFAYSNLGYVIVAAMLETRGQDSYESLMKKHIFDPLEMRSADFRSMKSAKQLQPPLLWGHRAGVRGPIDPRTVGAENPTAYASVGTVHLAIEDFAKYAQWQLAGKPAPVLRSQESFDHLHKPQVDHSLPGAKYGSGWICLETEHGRALNHAGSNTNTFAVIWVLPEAYFAAVVCTN